MGGPHFEHQIGTVTIPDGQPSATITITEHGVNEVYGDQATTGYSNASREYFVEIYRVDGGAVIEDNRATAKRTMTGNQTVDRNIFNEKTVTTVSDDDSKARIRTTSRKMEHIQDGEKREEAHLRIISLCKQESQIFSPMCRPWPRIFAFM